MPIFLFSSYRKFQEGEKHITRVLDEDVLLLILKGTLIFYENGYEIQLSKGEYYIQKARCHQSGTKPSLSPFYFFIHFHGMIDSSANGLPYRGKFSVEKLLPLINELNLLTSNPNSDLFKKNLVFMKIINELYEMQMEAKANDSIVEQACALLAANFKKEYTMKKLASDMGYSKDYIAKRFNAVLNMTPHEYLTNIRINSAKSLLITSNMSVKEIYVNCGFKEASTFHRTFFSRVGFTPHQFRLQYIKNNIGE